MANPYNVQVASVESGGNATAKNPRSSATGLYQFTRPTWLSLMRNYPELGLTLDGMTNNTQQEAAMEALTGENRASLAKTLGRDPTNAELYGAHVFGALTFNRLATADPSASVLDIVGPDVVAANPQFRGKTIADVQSWLAGKMGDVQNGADPSYSPVVRDVGPAKQIMPVQEASPDAQAAEQGGSSGILSALAGALGGPQAQGGVKSDVGGWLNDQGFSNDALLRFGSGMLSGANFQDGLAKGFQGVAAQRQLDKQTADTKTQRAKAEALKLMELGVDPKLAQEVASGAKGYDALTNVAAKKQYGDWKWNKDANRYERTDPKTGNLEVKDAPGTATDQFDVNTTMSKLDEAMGLVGEDGIVGPYAGTIGSLWDRYGAGSSGREDKRRKLDDIITNNVLQAAEKLKPLSDSDMKFLTKGSPNREDSPERWKAWITEAKQRLQAAAQAKGLKPPTSSTGPGVSPGDAALIGKYL